MDSGVLTVPTDRETVLAIETETEEDDGSVGDSVNEPIGVWVADNTALKEATYMVSDVVFDGCIVNEVVGLGVME